VVLGVGGVVVVDGPEPDGSVVTVEPDAVDVAGPAAATVASEREGTVDDPPTDTDPGSSSPVSGTVVSPAGAGAASVSGSRPGTMPVTDPGSGVSSAARARIARVAGSRSIGWGMATMPDITAVATTADEVITVITSRPRRSIPPTNGISARTARGS
jgi:hypothetical protein